MLKNIKQIQKIGVIGLGYVGLPLAVEFSKKYSVIAFDINRRRILELLEGRDSTFEVPDHEIYKNRNIKFTSEYKDLSKCKIFIISVPTPIDDNKCPDFEPLIKASDLVGGILKKDDIVIYESTVYPGATEEICVPRLEKISSFKLNSDFYVGYSPERINPGDKKHRLTDICKITSGSTSEVATLIDNLYSSIILAGTHKAPSIKVAEAAKVIENTQRDLNIALINELSIIFGKLNINTQDVLNAARTKWNFLHFSPGLVGGHCIGVDPYYLTHKAESIGHHPQIILAGRRLNDDMGTYIANQLVKEMIKCRIHLKGSKVLVMGLTFKENCHDLRNTKVVDVIKELEEFGSRIEVFDPMINKQEANKTYKVKTIEEPSKNKYDAIIIAVAHDVFKNLGISKIRSFGKKNHLIYDLKSLFSSKESDMRL